MVIFPENEAAGLLAGLATIIIPRHFTRYGLFFLSRTLLEGNLNIDELSLNRLQEVGQFNQATFED